MYEKKYGKKKSDKPYDPSTDWVERFQPGFDTSERDQKKNDKKYWHLLYTDWKRKFPFLLTNNAGGSKVVWIDRETYNKLGDDDLENKIIVLNYLHS